MDSLDQLLPTKTSKEGHSYQPLAIDIVQNGGHHYRQAWRDEHAAVYEQRGDRRIVIGYEAITIKKRPEEMKFGKLCPARELYPCSEDWGKIAVTRRTLESAIEAAELFSTRAASRAPGQIHRPVANLVGSGQPSEVAAYTYNRTVLSPACGPVASFPWAAAWSPATSCAQPKLNRSSPLLLKIKTERKN